MAFVHRDFLGPARMFWNMNMAIYRTFKKVFPTKTVDGHLVYNNQLNLYSGGQVTTDNQTKRFLNKLGFEYETLHEQNYKGVKRLYMTFDSKKYQYQTKTNTELLSEVAARFEVDDVFSIKITYGGASLRYFDNHDLIISDINFLINKLDSDPKKYYAGMDINDTTYYSSITTSTQNNANVVSPISLNFENFNYETFALLDDGTYFERTNIRNVDIRTSETRFEGKIVDEISLVYDYKVIQKPNNENSQLITYLKDISDIIEDTSSPLTNLLNKRNKFLNSSKSVIREALIDMQPFDDTVFYQNYLRVDAVSNMKKSEFIELLALTIKIDYEEEDTEWWEVALMILVVVVASIVAFPVGAGAATAITASAIAISLGTFSAILTVGLYVVSAISTSGNLGMVGRLIGKVAQFTGIAASIIGVYGALKSLGTQLLKDAGGVSLNQIGAASKGIENLYSTYENINGKQEEVEEEIAQEMPKSTDIVAYGDVLMENDALTLMDMKIEQSLAGNKTLGLIENQAK